MQFFSFEAPAGVSSCFAFFGMQTRCCETIGRDLRYGMICVAVTVASVEATVSSRLILEDCV